MEKKFEKLTEDSLWDEVWREYRVPQTIKEGVSPNYIGIIDNLFHQYLPKNREFELLELGCAPGRWLHYFNSEFGYRVTGLDSSPAGIKITKENLDYLGVRGEVILGDAFDYKFNRQFDVVFSFGLIEHFDPPVEIVKKHLDLVNRGGYLVLAVPNIKESFYKPLQYLCNPKNMEGYLHISKERLQKFFTAKNGAEILFCDYIGVFNLYLLNIPANRKLIHKLVYLAQNFVEKMIKLFNITKETGLFSPYIFIIVKKNGK